MTQPATTQPQDADAVRVDVQQITALYQQALADEAQRRIMAEAMVDSLKAERAELRATVQALSPGAPTVQENSP